MLSQEEAIRADIRAAQPLVGEKEDFSCLRLQYADNPRFLHKIQSAGSQYSHIRRVRGDGNCFYRSYLFAVLEFAILPPPSVPPAQHFAIVAAFHSQFLSAPAAMQADGVYDSVIVDDFYSNTLELVQFAVQRSIAQQGKQDWTEAERGVRRQLLAELLSRMNDDSQGSLCNWYITWLRCLTSAQLQRRPELYSPYLVDHSSIKAFCAAEVDCMNREVDAVQILALTTELGVAVRIEYLDGSEGSGLHGYVMPEGKQEDGVVTLLYRPGHYDIIYRREDTPGKGDAAAEAAGTAAGTEGEQPTQRSAGAAMTERKEEGED